MVKILTYIDNKTKDGFYRSSKNENKEKISAETEIDQMLSDGWELLSATTSEFVAGAFTATTSFAKLTVIMRKDG